MLTEWHRPVLSMSGMEQRQYQRAAQTKVGHIVRDELGWTAHFDGRFLARTQSTESARILVDAHAKAWGATC